MSDDKPVDGASPKVNGDEYCLEEYDFELFFFYFWDKIRLLPKLEFCIQTISVVNFQFELEQSTRTGEFMTVRIDSFMFFME